MCAAKWMWVPVSLLLQPLRVGQVSGVKCADSEKHLGEDSHYQPQELC